MLWIVLSVLFLLMLCVFVIIYFLYKRSRKKGSFAKTFSENILNSDLQMQIEETGNIIIQKMAEQIKHLEYLIEESDAKMLAIDHKMKELTKVLNQAQNISLMGGNYKEISNAKKEKPESVSYTNSSMYSAYNNNREKSEEQLSFKEKEKTAESFTMPLTDYSENLKRVQADKFYRSSNEEREMLFLERKNMQANNSGQRNMADNKTEIRKLVLAMNEQGYDANAIAKATGMARGEVSLILQLNKK